LNGTTPTFAIPESRMLNHIAQTFRWKGMQTYVEAFVKSCNKCQCYKIIGKLQYGILPLVPALKAKMPFRKVQVDCAGPWTVRFGSKASKDKIKYQMQVMLMVDAGTGWLELTLIPSAISRSCATHFDKQWLCHYPRPMNAVMTMEENSLQNNFKNISSAMPSNQSQLQ
jgi:hypothetical protein